MPPMPHLVEQARQWVAGGGLIAPRFNRRAAAGGAIEPIRQVRVLAPGATRDPDLDPIEDFVVNNPRGHCEYFATALALMLRSQGITGPRGRGIQVRRLEQAGQVLPSAAVRRPRLGRGILGAGEHPPAASLGPARGAGAAGHGCGSTPRRPPPTCWLAGGDMGKWQQGLTGSTRSGPTM